MSREVLLQDTIAYRVAAVPTEMVGPVLAGWLAEDGVREPSRNVARLVRALESGDWSTVHSVAEHLGWSVSLIGEAEAETGERRKEYADRWSAPLREPYASEPEPLTLAERLAEAAEAYADQSGGWGLLGALS